jgi:hypothetical protein
MKNLESLFNVLETVNLMNEKLNDLILVKVHCNNFSDFKEERILHMLLTRRVVRVNHLSLDEDFYDSCLFKYKKINSEEISLNKKDLELIINKDFFSVVSEILNLEQEYYKKNDVVEIEAYPGKSFFFIYKNLIEGWVEIEESKMVFKGKEYFIKKEDFPKNDGDLLRFPKESRKIREKLEDIKLKFSLVESELNFYLTDQDENSYLLEEE